MTQNEIISMMKEAGFHIGKDDEFEPAWERFAALVAAHERDACAKVCLETGIKHPQQTGQEACAIAIRAR